MITRKQSLALAVLASATLALPALADTEIKANISVDARPMGILQRNDDNEGMQVVFGTVTSINGTTFTVLGKQNMDRNYTASTTFTVNANATTLFKKNSATTTLSGLKVGDVVMVQGRLSGSTIVAAMIRDGKLADLRGDKDREDNDRNEQKKENDKRIASSSPLITGNGQPVVAGTISAINGNTITLASQGNLVYTIDASSAKIVQGRKVIGLSTLSVGDSIIVQGAVNGSTVTASSIVGEKVKLNSNGKPSRGFFGGLGDFFRRLFGF